MKSEEYEKVIKSLQKRVEIKQKKIEYLENVLKETSSELSKVKYNYWKLMEDQQESLWNNEEDDDWNRV